MFAIRIAFVNGSVNATWRGWRRKEGISLLKANITHALRGGWNKTKVVRSRTRDRKMDVEERRLN